MPSEKKKGPALRKSGGEGLTVANSGPRNWWGRSPKKGKKKTGINTRRTNRAEWERESGSGAFWFVGSLNMHCRVENWKLGKCYITLMLQNFVFLLFPQSQRYPSYIPFLREKVGNSSFFRVPFFGQRKKWNDERKWAFFSFSNFLRAPPIFLPAWVGGCGDRSNWAQFILRGRKGKKEEDLSETFLTGKKREVSVKEGGEKL